jgi:hypothetical protein
MIKVIPAELRSHHFAQRVWAEDSAVYRMVQAHNLFWKTFRKYRVNYGNMGSGSGSTVLFMGVIFLQGVL